MVLLAVGACGRLGVIPTNVPVRTDPNATDVPKTGIQLVPVRYEDLPGWKTDRHSDVLPALIRSCEKFETLPKNRPVGVLEEMGRIRDWLPICQSARIIRPGNAAETQYFFESQLQAYSIGSQWADSGLFTGYFEAEINGAFKADRQYRFPIHSRPKDLISADLGDFDLKYSGTKLAGRLHKGAYVPYYSRGEIEDGALDGRQLEILWADNPIDVFSLHIQGSGRVNLPDGTSIRLRYAGRNGHKYTAVGRELVAAGQMKLDDVSMPTIRAWMEENPVGGQALRRKNKSYIFFRVGENTDPVGAQGVKLTAGRSLAVDNRFVPYGVPLWLSTTDPGTKPKKPLRRLVVAQDTGAAIRGAIRGDLFWGYGPEAALKAGLMKERGTYFLLLPKTARRKVTN